jgi:3-hydroxymyristoyl/3-hydroxydecanoyl-(acyl carrier protein) dehydratase
LRPPHRFPFELIDREVEGAGRLAVTAGSWWLRGPVGLSLPWIVEAAAQAAARLLAGKEGDRGGLRRLALAGIDAAELARPVEPGETCELRVRLAGRFATLIKVESELAVGGAPLGRLALLLASPLDEAAPTDRH